jgi:SCY1-like protein 1
MTRKPLLIARIRYIDSVETDTHVYIATERVRPLEGVLRDWPTGSSKGKGKEEWIGWGVRSISVSLRGITELMDRLP